MKTNKSNKGFTLIELIVVVAILAIMTGVLTLSSSIVQSGKAKKFINEYSSMLSQCRIDTLCGAKNAYLELKCDGSNYTAALYENGSVVKTKELGSASMFCGYGYDSSGTLVEVDLKDADLYLAYDRTTGAFLNLEDVVDSSGNSLNNTASGKILVVVVKNVRSYGIEMVPETGYSTIAG